jgi:hypothetical protein
LNCAAKKRVKAMHKKLCEYVDHYKQVKWFYNRTTVHYLLDT